MEIKVGEYKIVLKKDYLTYGESVELQKLLLSATGGLKPNEKGEVDFELKNPVVIFEINMKTLEFLVDKIITPDGKEIKGDLRSFINNLPADVATEIFEKVNEITKKKQSKT